MRHTRIMRRVLLCSAATLASGAAFAQDDITDLDPIILDGGKREVSTDTATSVTTIDDEEAKDRQATTIAELVDSVPGVTLINGATPQGGGINIRGFGANSTYGNDQKVILQVDDADVGSEELYRIGTQLYTDPALYKKVEVTRGMAGSFEYGSGAIGGMVRLETRNASDFTKGEPGFKLRETLQFNSNGNGVISSTILAWQPTEDFEILGNYTYSTQDTQVDGDGNAIGNSAFDLPSWQLKARKTWNGGEHALTFSMTDTNSTTSDVPYDAFGTTGGSFGNVDRDNHTRSAGLKYEYNPDNDLIHFSANLTYGDQEINNTYVAGSSPLEGTGSWPFLEPLVNAKHRFETTKLTLKNKALFSTGAAEHDLRAGVEFKRRKRKDAPSAPGGTDDRIAVFVVDDITMGNWTLSPAVRYETQDIEAHDGSEFYSNDAVMGGLSARYEFDNGVALFGSAAISRSLAIIDDFGNATKMTTVESARTFELGASYDGVDVFTGGDELAVKLVGYKTKMWDITSVAVGFTTIPEIETDGLELEASYSMENGFYVDLNGNRMRGDYQLPTPGYFRGVPADSLRLTLGKKWGKELDLSWEMMHHFEMTRVNAPDPTTDAGTIHNLRATYRPQAGVLQGAELRLGIENVGDKAYKPHLASKIMPGRTVKFSIAKTF